MSQYGERAKQFERARRARTNPQVLVDEGCPGDTLHLKPTRAPSEGRQVERAPAKCTPIEIEHHHLVRFEAGIIEEEVAVAETPIPWLCRHMAERRSTSFNDRLTPLSKLGCTLQRGSNTGQDRKSVV